MRICERIQCLQRASYADSRLSGTKSRRSGASKPPSHKSSLRSVSLARADAAAKAAKVKIEMEYLEKESELERIRLEKQYALAKAEENALKEILDEESKRDDQIKKEITPDERFKSSPINEPTMPETIKRELNPASPPYVPKVSPEVLCTQTTTQSCESSNMNLALI